MIELTFIESKEETSKRLIWTGDIEQLIEYQGEKWTFLIYVERKGKRQKRRFAIIKERIEDLKPLLVGNRG